MINNLNAPHNLVRQERRHQIIGHRMDNFTQRIPVERRWVDSGDVPATAARNRHRQQSRKVSQGALLHPIDTITIVHEMEKELRGAGQRSVREEQKGLRRNPRASWLRFGVSVSLFGAVKIVLENDVAQPW